MIVALIIITAVGAGILMFILNRFINKRVKAEEPEASETK
ncbi:unnamed protein product [marine sediment metagenome]|uniref:Uncharacterized protein n=1 Tax=marine sediment metagenome TaxID=412755 RepID=X0RYL7_9ZZZZ